MEEHGEQSSLRIMTMVTGYVVIKQLYYFRNTLIFKDKIRKRASPDIKTKKELVYVYITSPEFKKE
jgi:hypothetical protein